MFALWSSPNHIPIKYRGPIKKSNCIAPAYLYPQSNKVVPVQSTLRPKMETWSFVYNPLPKQCLLYIRWICLHFWMTWSMLLTSMTTLPLHVAAPTAYNLSLAKGMSFQEEQNPTTFISLDVNILDTDNKCFSARWQHVEAKWATHEHYFEEAYYLYSN